MRRIPFAMTLSVAATLGLCAAGCGESHDYSCEGPACDLDAGTDAGGDPELFACAGPEDCVVIPASCCGACGAATREDSVSVSRDHAGDWSSMVCGDDVGCPGCFMEQDPTLVAGCEESRCVVVDLHEHASTQCGSASDCVVRTRDCCECGGDVSRAGLVAINGDRRADFERLVCNEGTGCPECAPAYPPEATPQCNSAGYCEVVWPLGG